MKKIIIAFTLLISGSALAEIEKLSPYIGNWSCEQEEQITESVLGSNLFFIDFDANTVEQAGTAVIHDTSSNRRSIVKYNILFEMTLNGSSQFLNVVQKVEYSIVKDELSMFGNGVSIMPNTGDEVRGKIIKLSETRIRNVYSDGKIIDCIKSLARSR